jgi:hypothetical protein
MLASELFRRVSISSRCSPRTVSRLAAQKSRASFGLRASMVLKAAIVLADCAVATLSFSTSGAQPRAAACCCKRRRDAGALQGDVVDARVRSDGRHRGTDVGVHGGVGGDFALLAARRS